MPTLVRPDGAEIHWEEHGDGPLVVIASYWSMYPPVFDHLTEELESDHRVVLYDDRGTGRSSRQGPYDMETSAADLAGVIEAAGPPAVVVCSADGANRAVRVLQGDPDLVQAMVCVGGAPVGRKAFTNSDAMAASDTVVAALMSQVETDYRGALRGVLTATNPQMTEAELRERVSIQSEHCPHEAAVARMRAWIDDDPSEQAKAAGDRLWIGVSENLGGGWFPSGAELARRVRDGLPEAHIVEISDGFVSRPDETAAIIRRVTAQQGALGRAE
jgi:pimeloyl-ACP methyl ester carboxylesterase